MLTTTEKMKIDRFQEALTVVLVAEHYGAATVEERAELVTARGEMQQIVGAEAEYREAVDAAHREVTACMVARWQTPRRAPPLEDLLRIRSDLSAHDVPARTP
jgi:hypothetical protein